MKFASLLSEEFLIYRKKWIVPFLILFLGLKITSTQTKTETTIAANETDSSSNTTITREVCKFHEKYYIAGGYSRRIRNIYTKQDCAIDVHKIYPDATGAQWNGYNYCFARFGGKFSLRDDRYHSWACIFQPLYQDLRLVDGKDEYEGRIEILYQDEWGTVCNDDFEMNDAHVTCRMMDLIGARSVKKFGPGSGRIWLDDLECNGNETNLFNCTSSEIGVHDCAHSEDIGVVCERCDKDEYACDDGSCIYHEEKCDGYNDCDDGSDESNCNGQWGEWELFSRCTKTCGTGTKFRTRKCDSPSPSGDGEDCFGDEQEKRECNTISCVNLWPVLSKNKTCADYSYNERTNDVTNQLECQQKCIGSIGCVGITYSYDEYYMGSCIICFDDNLSSRYDFGFYKNPAAAVVNTVRCTTERYQKVYNCVFPFIYKGKTYENCTSDHSRNGKAWCAFYIKPGSVVPYNRKGDCNPDCPGEVDGQWGSWGSYSLCSKTCGMGTRSRTRKCNNPSPFGDGKYCVGDEREAIECYIISCGDCVAYTEDACRSSAVMLGLKLGGGGYEFKGKYLTKGCYAYTNESRGFAGMIYYSTGGTNKEMKEAPTVYNQYRPFGYDCKGIYHTVTIQPKAYPYKRFVSDVYNEIYIGDENIVSFIEVRPGLTGEKETVSFRSTIDGKYMALEEYKSESDLKLKYLHHDPDIAGLATFKVLSDRFFTGFDAFEPIKQPGFSVRLVRKRYYTTKYYSHIVRTDPNDYLINEGDKQEASFKIVGGIPGQPLPNTTYNGYCLDPRHNLSYINYISVKDVYKCHVRCKITNGCTAFAFHSKSSVGSSNCVLYGKRSYVAGTGAPNVICYILPDDVSKSSSKEPLTMEWTLWGLSMKLSILTIICIVVVTIVILCFISICIRKIYIGNKKKGNKVSDQKKKKQVPIIKVSPVDYSTSNVGNIDQDVKNEFENFEEIPGSARYDSPPPSIVATHANKFYYQENIRKPVNN